MRRESPSTAALRVLTNSLSSWFMSQSLVGRRRVPRRAAARPRPPRAPRRDLLPETGVESRAGAPVFGSCGMSFAFVSGPQSGSHGHVSRPPPSNQTCGFPASGLRTSSCRRARKADDLSRQVRDAVGVGAASCPRIARVARFSPCASARPPAHPPDSVPIECVVGGADLPDAEVDRPSGHVPVQADGEVVSVVVTVQDLVAIGLANPIENRRSGALELASQLSCRAACWNQLGHLAPVLRRIRRGSGEREWGVC